MSDTWLTSPLGSSINSQATGSINTFLFFLFFFLTTPAIIINTIDMYNVTRPIEKLQVPPRLRPGMGAPGR